MTDAPVSERRTPGPPEQGYGPPYPEQRGPDAGVGWERVDIDTADGELRGEFGDRIPVTLVDGEEHASWRVDPGALRTALAA